MPRKKTTAQPKPAGPNQGTIARLLTDSLSMFADQLLVDLSGDFSRDELLEIKNKVTKTKDRINNNAIDQLLKHY